ncbi:hypothetical protein [Aliagarivorans marinus]|uniref:hypothetical protein n=1 Tax=Aliagarivorans marinus TaxID=561965 RepID=UPI000425E62E|nr:hypothetical protein [Aliagarivorans marinus]
MKKFLVPAILLVIVSLQYFTHHSYQQHSESLLSELAQQDDLTVTLLDRQRSPVSYQERWQLELALDEKQSWTFYIDQKVQLLPLWASSNWQLDMTQGSIQTWLHRHGLTQIPHQGKWQANLWLDQLNSQLEVRTFSGTLDTLPFTVQPLSARFSSDLAGTKGALEMTWQGGSILGLNNSNHITIIGLSLSERFTRLDQQWLAERSHWSLKQLNWVSEGFKLAANDLDTQNQYLVENGLSYLDLQTRVAKITSRSKGQRLELANLQLDAQLGGVEEQLLLELIAQQSQSPSAEEQQQLLQALLNKPLLWELRKFAFDIDVQRIGAKMQGDVDAKAKFIVQPFRLEDISYAQQLLRYLDVNAHMSVNEEFFDNSPYRLYVEGLRQVGYLDNIDGRDQVNLIFNDSEFSLNRLPMPLL